MCGAEPLAARWLKAGLLESESATAVINKCNFYRASQKGPNDACRAPVRLLVLAAARAEQRGLAGDESFEPCVVLASLTGAVCGRHWRTRFQQHNHYRYCSALSNIILRPDAASAVEFYSTAIIVTVRSPARAPLSRSSDPFVSTRPNPFANTRPKPADETIGISRFERLLAFKSNKYVVNVSAAHLVFHLVSPSANPLATNVSSCRPISPSTPLQQASI